MTQYLSSITAFDISEKRAMLWALSSSCATVETMRGNETFHECCRIFFVEEVHSARSFHRQCCSHAAGCATTAPATTLSEHSRSWLQPICTQGANVLLPLLVSYLGSSQAIVAFQHRSSSVLGSHLREVFVCVKHWVCLTGTIE